MKHLLLSIVIFTSVGQTFAGAGSTGGGQGQNGFLRELLVAPEIKCEGINIAQTVNEYPTLKKVFETIELVNPSFGYELVKEAEKVEVCKVNGRLNSNLVQNQNGIIVSPSSFDQLALRVEKYGNRASVYLGAEFDDMANEEQQSFLLFHELMHSFVSTSPAVTYISRLRSFVASIYKGYKNNSLNLTFLNRIARSSELKSSYNEGYKTPAEKIEEIANFPDHAIIDDRIACLKKFIKTGYKVKDSEISQSSKEELYELMSREANEFGAPSEKEKELFNLLELIILKA